MQNSIHRKSWSLQEDQMIKKLVQQFGIQDWTQISNKFKEEYPSSNRSGKQCRQRWYNHLSPHVSKKAWTLEEQNKLFKLHRELGNKWKQISKKFIGRTDNDLKNHFYSTLRKSLRRLNKSLGEKNSTSHMRQIKPSVLSQIMGYIYEDQSQPNLVDQLKDIPSLIFEFANFKPMKSGILLKDDQTKQKVIRIFNLISEFNCQYEKSKNQRKLKLNIKKQRINKINKSKKQQKQILMALIQNDIQLQKNPNQTQFDKFNQQIKNSITNDFTQIQIQITNSSMSMIHENIRIKKFNFENQDQLQEYDFKLVPKKSGIFDEYDQIMSEFHDPQQPSVINDYVFNQNYFNNKNNLQKKQQYHNYCMKIVDQLFDTTSK